MFPRVIDPRVIIRAIIRVLIARVAAMGIDGPRQHAREALPLVAVAVESAVDFEDRRRVDKRDGFRDVHVVVGHVEHADVEVVFGDDGGEVGVSEDYGEFVAFARKKGMLVGLMVTVDLGGGGCKDVPFQISTAVVPGNTV